LWAGGLPTKTATWSPADERMMLDWCEATLRGAGDDSLRNIQHGEIAVHYRRPMTAAEAHKIGRER